ncbi:MAG: chemotaxis protein CheB, partial [Verrucomicrobia bacterium]
MKTKSLIATSLALVSLASSPSSRADVVTDWNHIMLAALVTANLSPIVADRAAAIVQTSVYDAVNGIQPRYAPYHVAPGALPGASVRAAVVEAAYEALVKLFPMQKPAFDVQWAASLAAITDDGEFEDSESIARGLAWGQSVADAIVAWRSMDGFTPPPPPFLGGTAVGQWRPTPPPFLPGAGPQFAYMTPWAMTSPAQFHPAGPPALTNDAYAADFNEVKLMGSIGSAARTADQTLFARFWASDSPVGFWDRAAVAVGAARHTTLSENARLLALLNIAMADANIACWEAKYTYVFWRPITAIRLADTDGNPATDLDVTWTPLLITPAFPEYPGGHSTASGVAAAILAAYYGDDTAFPLESPGMPGVVRYYS